MDLFNRLNAWVLYRTKSKTKFRIHSPFVFDLVVNVFEDHLFYPEYKKVEDCRKQLLNDRRSIIRVDLGTGSSRPANPLKVSEIVKRHCLNISDGRLLFRITKKFLPKKILELGTSLGISTFYMAAANPESTIFTVEGCPETSNIARETFEIMFPGQISLITGSFDMVLPGLVDKEGPFDLIFIDGNHKMEAVLLYFDRIMTKIHNDTIIIIDDIHWSPQMESAWSEICKNGKVKVTIDLFRMGLVFFKKELSKEDFVIRYC